MFQIFAMPLTESYLHMQNDVSSVMEAMACGKPVIVTSVGDVPVLVKSGVNGIVIPPGNADLLAGSIISLTQRSRLSKENSGRNIY